MKNFGCHGNELPIKEILYQSVFGDKYYTIGHKFTISVTMDVSPFAWCLGGAVLNICWIPRMLFEHEADRPSVQHHPRDPASVNAMKQRCVIVILAYFTLFQPNSH